VFVCVFVFVFVHLCSIHKHGTMFFMDCLTDIFCESVLCWLVLVVDWIGCGRMADAILGCSEIFE